MTEPPSATELVEADKTSVVFATLSDTVVVAVEVALTASKLPPALFAIDTAIVSTVGGSP